MKRSGDRQCNGAAPLRTRLRSPLALSRSSSPRTTLLWFPALIEGATAERKTVTNLRWARSHVPVVMAGCPLHPCFADESKGESSDVWAYVSTFRYTHTWCRKRRKQSGSARKHGDSAHTRITLLAHASGLPAHERPHIHTKTRQR